jgi:hypothetical protein
MKASSGLDKRFYEALDRNKMGRNIRRTVVAALCVTLGLFMASTAKTLPHHGFTAYDLNRQITLDGTVTEFRFRNPHV